VEAKINKDKIVIQRRKSILVKKRRAKDGISAGQTERAKIYYEDTKDNDRNYLVCTICMKRVLRIISHLRYHLRHDHHIELSEKDALLIYMPKERAAGSCEYYFLRRRPDIPVVNPGSGKRR
jgi:hypothetical protein